MVKKVLSAILRTTGKSVDFSELRSADVLGYVVAKAFPGLWKLFYYRLTLGKAGANFLVGRGTRILCKRKLFVGRNCYISDYSYINCLSKNGVTFGDRVTLRERAWLQLTSDLSNLGEGVRIGSNVYIGPGVVLGAAGWVIIGEGCQIGANVQFIAENHNFEKSEISISSQGVNRKGIEIGAECWIGNNVIILDGVRVGKGVVIGAGSVVVKDLEDNGVYIGNPARLIRKRS